MRRVSNIEGVVTLFKKYFSPSDVSVSEKEDGATEIIVPFMPSLIYSCVSGKLNISIYGVDMLHVRILIYDL